MKVNIYYGGRGIIDDPTLYVLDKMEEVLVELRVNVDRYNIYEHKSSISTLPQTMKDADGIILATTVEWLGIGGYMQPFLDACQEYGVHGEYIRQIPGKTGHTIIQIDKNAQNCILLFGGANQMLTKEYIDGVLSHFQDGDILLLQNEVNDIAYMVERAYEKGMQIALNPSPFNERLDDVDMDKISIFLLNEIEGGQITGLSDPDKIFHEMCCRFPKAKIVLTLGSDGAVYGENGQSYKQPIFPVQAVDTTAAGDTFTGYFLA